MNLNGIGMNLNCVYFASPCYHLVIVYMWLVFRDYHSNVGL